MMITKTFSNSHMLVCAKKGIYWNMVLNTEKISAISIMLTSIQAPPKSDMDVFVEYLLPKLDRLCATEGRKAVSMLLVRLRSFGHDKP